MLIERAMDTIDIDYFGPYLRTKSENKYLFVIVDGLSRYIIQILD